MISVDLILKTLTKKLDGIQAIYLFGTHETEFERIGSDIDLAVLLKHPQVTLNHSDKLRLVYLFAECQSELSISLKKEVDLINLRSVSTVFQHEIILSGRLIYQDNPTSVMDFEMITMSLYQKLNEERKHILDDFQRTGKAYRV